MPQYYYSYGTIYHNAHKSISDLLLVWKNHAILKDTIIWMQTWIIDFGVDNILTDKWYYFVHKGFSICQKWGSFFVYLDAKGWIKVQLLNVQVLGTHLWYTRYFPFLINEVDILMQARILWWSGKDAIWSTLES